MKATAGIVSVQVQGSLDVEGIEALPDELQPLAANSGHSIMEMHCGVLFIVMYGNNRDK